MMPVTLITRNLNLDPAVVAVYGSLREGRADLREGYRIDWKTELHLLRLESPLIVSGQDTRIEGLLLTGLSGVSLAGLNGRAGPGLAKLVPGSWECDMAARVNEVGFGWTWTYASATGDVITPSGTCKKDGRDLTIPPLNMLFGSEGRDAIATLSTGQEPPMVDMRLRRERVLDITIRPKAAEVFPQLPSRSPLNLTIPF